ncbi:MAG TPA: NAD(P)/FAD-dependent oxidoreductase [Kofleriaceae bacterium]|jgi:phytoene dehydrogenase-like protein|nr:NAD(P)/FAD-dependent oxidoreductase [Kofleriaceae bacterium]
MSNSNRPRQTMIIVGAGIAGLSTGCYAQMNGYRSRIFELHEVPGGGCAGWKRGEFGFDGCLSWLVGSGPGNELYQLWLELGALEGKEIRHFEMFNAVETADGHIVRFYSDPDRLQEHLSELAPRDGRRIRAFCQALRQCQGCLAAVPFLRPVGLMGKLDRLRLYLRFARFYRAITRSLATRIADCADRFESPVLREAFHYVLYDHTGQLSMLPLYFQLACHGSRAAGVPEGGAPGLARSIEARYLALGGQIRYSARVEEILVENDRAIGVRLSDGQRHLADVVVTDGDGAAVAELLHGRYVNPVWSPPAEAPGAIAPGSLGHVALFLGLDRRFPEAEHGTTHLLTEDEAAELPGIVHPGLHVQFRNRHYPELSPPGTSAIFASYLCDAARWRALSQGDDRRRQRRGIEVRAVAARRGRSYPHEKRRVAEFLTGYLDRKYPGLADALVVRDVATPVSPLRCTGAHGDTVLPWQPFAARDLGDTARPAIPGLRNVYRLGGRDGGGGMVRDATAGRHVMQFICKDDRRPFTAWIDDAAVPPTHVIVPPGGRRIAALDAARAPTAPGVTSDRPVRELPGTRW